MIRLKMLILILFCQFTVQACRQLPNVSREVENVDSILLDTMMQSTDFVGKTSWRTELIKQVDETPADNNNWLIEVASHGLSGDFNGKFYIVIDNRLSRYDEPINWIEPFSNIYESAEEEVVIFLPPDVGNNTRAQCLKSKDAVRCEVIVQYEYLISHLWMYGPGNLEMEDVSQILDPIILAIDSRIEQ